MQKMAEESLDMSLDDIIKKNKQQQRIPQRRRPTNPRVTPYPIMPQVVVHRIPQQPMMMMNMMMVAGSESGHQPTKLFISNLDYAVSNDDIRLLFSDVGELKEYALHYDNTGRSKGTAEVVFSHHSDALAAIKRYNNMQLDGRPMKIELVGVNVLTHPMPAMPDFAPKSLPVQRPGVAAHGRNHSTRRESNMIGRGGLTKRNHHRPISAKDLDADLDKYHSDAVQIN